MSNNSHQITINGTLEPELFFFVFTHEIAHLVAFHEKKNILPHGKEWKATFQKMLLESISIYSEELKPLILNFAKNPKANFMSSPELVKYFDSEHSDNKAYVEDLPIGEKFIYQTDIYQIEEKKKNLIQKIKSDFLTLKPRLEKRSREIMHSSPPSRKKESIRN